jgi:pimeloyl-ACP methyl ester carboxylesterase
MTLLLFLIGCSVSRVYNNALESKAKRVGLIEHQVQLGEASVHYWMGGEGPPLLILHGFGGDALRTWARQLRTLAKHRTLILPDMLFFGKSTASQQPSLNLQAESFIALIDHLGLSQVDVMGISYGGFVTMEMKQNGGDAVGRIILVDSPGGHFGREDEAALLTRFEVENPEEIFIPQDWRAVRRLMHLVFYRPPWLPPWVYRDVKKEVFSKNREEQLIMLAELRGRETDFFQRDWSNTQALVLWGEHDPVFPPALGAALSETLDAEFIVFEKAGHGPNLEHPRRFNKLVLQWLDTGSLTN